METMNYHFAGEENIPSPQLVYYKENLVENIRHTIQLAGGTERLWPHIKTHKMQKAVELQVSMGIKRFKCATIAEAEMCANAGAEHLVLAYPLVGPNIGRFVRLCQKFEAVQFYAIGDDTEQIRLLGEAAQQAGMTVKVLMDMDMGQHRTGVDLDCAEAMYAQWEELPGIHMVGMHCYDGHRHESDFDVRNAAVCEVDVKLEKIKADLKEKGLCCDILIMGGTPSFPCHAAATEEYLSPGTCIVQDAGYRDAYPDLQFTPAAALLVRVISRPTEDTFTLDLGTKAVASDPNPERAVLVGMEYAHTVLQNEEHWVVKVPQEHIQDIPPVGTVLYAIPWHVCPTSALYPSVPVIENGKLTEWWDVTARNRAITI